MVRQNKILFFVLSLIFSLSAFANQEEETPKFLLFLGRFHPLLLHLPIGALLLTFFMEIIGRIQKNDISLIISYALGFSAFFSVLTAIMGYLLSLEGGYGKDVLQIHMYAGFTMAGLTCLLYFTQKAKKSALKKSYLPLYLITLTLTIITGHYGSILTHGDTFLTTYSPISFEDEKELILETDSLYYYKNVITPILENKCVQCHNDNKIKGELNLTTIKHILAGGENGDIIKAGKIADSPIYMSLLLPIEEDKHMPPSGKPQLTRNEIWLIKHWIKTGADFKKQVAKYTSNDTLTNSLNDYLILPKRNVENAGMNEVSRLIAHGFTIKRLVYGEPFLSATYTRPNQKISKEAMQDLLDISEQLVELNLQESKLTDDLASSIKKLTSLRTLRLDKTMITDETLLLLKKHKELSVLNLFNTNISKNTLSELLTSIELEKVFFGNEENPEYTSTKEIEKEKNTTIVQGIKEGFIVKTKLEKPKIISNISIFENKTNIDLTGNLKEEKIRYTLDGEDPDSTSTIYEESILLNKSVLFKAKAFKKNWFPSDIVQRDFSLIKRQAKEITVKYAPNKSYTGIKKLIDLEKGSSSFRDGKWNGYLDDFDATLDLGEETTFEGVSVNCLERLPSYIFYPMNMEVYVGNDKVTMKKVGYLDIPPTDRIQDIKIKSFIINFPKEKARYIRVKMKSLKTIPTWHEGAGAEVYIFIDEVMVL
jgi:uncharacterized membrane protein